MAADEKRPSVRYGSAKMAADVKIDYIIDYLCDWGPALCDRCPSQCAYGKRYLKEYLPLTRKSGPQKRAQET